MFKTLFTVAAAVTLVACAHRHGEGHHAQHQAMSVTIAAAKPAPLEVSASLPVLSSGYKKVTAPADAAVYFVNLKNGDNVSSPVRVQFGLKGMGVAPAGVEKAGTGHHHLLVGVNSVDANAPLPTDDRHRHFGGGQTEVMLDLKPGTHTLQLLLADQNHIPHHPPVLSERITVNVR